MAKDKSKYIEEPTTDGPSHEQLVEALEYSMGLYSPAVSYLLITYNIRIPREKLKNLISVWGMESFVDEMRRSGVERILHKRKLAALEDGNSRSCDYMLAKYGHYAEYLIPKEDVDTSQSQAQFNDFMSQLPELRSLLARRPELMEYLKQDDGLEESVSTTD